VLNPHHQMGNVFAASHRNLRIELLLTRNLPPSAVDRSVIGLAAVFQKLFLRAAVCEPARGAAGCSTQNEDPEYQPTRKNRQKGPRVARSVQNGAGRDGRFRSRGGTQQDLEAGPAFFPEIL